MQVNYSFGRRSLSRLSTCHPVLQHLMRKVIARDDLPCDITVLCGYRNQAEQDAAYLAGNSKLQFPKSKHNSSPSMAVDIAPYIDGGVSWDRAWYFKLAPLVKQTWLQMTAEERGGHLLHWGGEFQSFFDGPHWELGLR